MKIAVVSCYDQTEYIRARILRKAFAAVPGAEAIIVKNTHKGLLRYLESPWKILKCAILQRPDAYVLLFRGYEMLPLLLLLKGRKPLIFDDLVNPVEYLYEHKRMTPGSAKDKIFRPLYSWMLRRCRIILADTESHIQYASEVCKVDASRYRLIPISTDESVFYPRKKKVADPKTFNVFFYGSYLPLHGVNHILEAAVMLADNPRITFSLGGCKGKGYEAYEAAIAKGARITYKGWFALDEIATDASNAGLTLAGPFGDTLQGQMVFTTKTFQFLACGAPIVLGKTKISGDFKDKENCLLVPQGSSRAIADAILWASEHPKELAQIAKNGRKLYEKDFSQELINKEIANIVEEL